MTPGEEIALKIDQTLTQDATGTLVMLEFEAMDLDRVKTELSAQYVDHNLIQEDFKNADDHLFLQSACQRFGVWFSRPGNGISHAVHMQRFGKPGKTLLGSDSHTPAAGSMGMLAIGAGGLEVALAMAGEPFLHQDARDLGRQAHRQAAGLGQRQGRDPGDAAPPRRRRRRGPHHRILRPGPGAPVGHGPARDRQHGRGTGRHHHRVPLRRRGAALPESAGRGDDWSELVADDDADYDVHERSTFPNWSR